MFIFTVFMFHFLCSDERERERNRERERERNRERETERQTDRQTGRQTDRQTERDREEREKQRERQIDRDRQRDRERGIERRERINNSYQKCLQSDTSTRLSIHRTSISGVFYKKVFLNIHGKTPGLRL